MRLAHVVTLGLISCGDKDPAAPDDSGKGSGGTQYELVSDDLPGGVLLAAWSDGDTLRMVGGNIGGTGGSMATVQDGVLCVQEDAFERPQWWIHGASEGAFYTVGEAGSITRFEGEQAHDESVDTESTLFGVWDTGTDVWAVGGDTTAGLGEIWKRDSNGWGLVATEIPGVVFKVWDGWFVGDEVAFRLEGEELVEVPLHEKILTVRGRDTDSDVWAVGGTGSATVLQWTGSAWQDVDTTYLSTPLSGVWTGPGESVYVAGGFGTMGRLDDPAEGWQMPDFPLTSDDFHAAWRHGDEVWYVGGNLLSSGGDYHGTIAREGDELVPIEVDGC